MKADIKTILEDFKNGKMVILLDDEDRENEGDLIIAADKITPEAVNFMATFGKGLICLTLTRDKCKKLDLPLMVSANNDKHSTNFTLSIEAAVGVTTGISASDRATTIKTAVNSNATKDDIVSPGHIFPLMARDGGVLTRAGHTEAGCDLARLCGLEPASVIVEILNDDGTMARRDDIEKFAKKHNIKWGTIEDLISYRLENEKTIIQKSSENFESLYGNFTKLTYQDNIYNLEHTVLISGEIGETTNVRVHMQDIVSDILGKTSSLGVADALNYISKNSGVFLLLNKDNNLQDDEKTFGIGAQILADVGVKSMNIISRNANYKPNTFKGFGLTINQIINI
jgi:3,4-dihydroxy 2-butanone 4-phosphate synthase/GTP cyclohydrolase II